MRREEFLLFTIKEGSFYDAVREEDAGFACFLVS
jgi:hypothetical protein